MFKGLGNIAGMMKQAQEMQSRMKELQDGLGRIRVEGSAGGGMVTVEATAAQKVLAVHIEPSLVEDREMLEDLLVAAVNQALEKAKEAAANEMSKLTEGMAIPGLQDALSKLGIGGTE